MDFGFGSGDLFVCDGLFRGHLLDRFGRRLVGRARVKRVKKKDKGRKEQSTTKNKGTGSGINIVGCKIIGRPTPGLGCIILFIYEYSQK